MRGARWLPAAACAVAFVLAWAASETEAGQRLDVLLLAELARLPGDSVAWAEASSPGDTLVAIGVLLAAAGTALALREPRTGWTIAACVLVLPMVWALKLAMGRERPETLLADDLAMPSGHAANAAVAYGAVALLLVPVLRRRGAPAWLRPLAHGAWLGLAFAVGVARVAAGVHWPTDVLAGWALGGLVLAIALLVVRPSPPAPAAEPEPTQPAL